MAWRHKLILVLLWGVTALTGRSVQAMTPEDRCAELYGIYYRYIADHNHHLDGDVARAELAKYRCENGQTADGLRTLEAILTRNRVRYPTE
jgi:hypothetical protein